MEIQTNGMFLTKEDEVKFNNWTKKEIYEAYLLEFIARKRIESEIIRLERKLAEIRFLTR